MNDLLKENLKWCLAIGMIILSGFVLIFTISLRSLDFVMLPSLVPVFGVGFGLLYIILQIGYCYYLCERKAFRWMITTLIIMSIVISARRMLAVDVPYSLLRDILVGSACTSGIVLGIGVLRGEL